MWNESQELVAVSIYPRGRAQEDHGSKPALEQIVHETLSQKNLITKGGGD
jgi:hypothetical protein